MCPNNLLVVLNNRDSHVSFSKVSASHIKKVKEHYVLNVKTPKWDTQSRLFEDNISSFTWSQATENAPAQRTNYMAYLKKIAWPDGYTIVDSSSKAFCVTMADYDFNGSIDVILADDSTVESQNELNGIHLGIELKKTIARDEHDRQVIIEHMCASKSNSALNVLTLLTDLNEQWFFFYFGPERKLFKLRATRPQAVFLLENMFNPENLAANTFPECFINRLNWDDFIKSLPQISGTSIQESINAGDRDESGGQNTDKAEMNFTKESGRHSTDNTEMNSKEYRNNQHGENTGMGRDTGHTAANVQLGGDVANELDLLEFLDDEVERRKIVYKFVIENFAPHVVWPDGTIGIPLDTIATKRVTSSHNQNNMGDNQLSALSEQNLLRHNVAAGLGQESSKN